MDVSGTQGSEYSTAGQPDSQTANANTNSVEDIRTLEDSNLPKPDESQNTPPVNNKWEGDSRYFQTGDKAGTLKPRFRKIGGVSARQAQSAPPINDGVFKGLDVDALKNGAAKRKEIVDKITAEDKKKIKEEKRQLSAEFSARVVMRLLDAVVNIISKGQFGENFNDEQLKKRLTYREALKDEWKEYLLTLDVDLAPWAMVAVGSLEYVGESFNTPAGKARVTTLREKVLGGIFRATIGRFFK